MDMQSDGSDQDEEGPYEYDIDSDLWTDDDQAAGENNMDVNKDAGDHQAPFDIDMEVDEDTDDEYFKGLEDEIVPGPAYYPAPGKRIGNDLFEERPHHRLVWAKKRNVHFNIDPTNIFIGELDEHDGDHEHYIIPRLKLGDFSCAKKIKPNKSNDYYLVKRQLGTWSCFAPEQFGNDWDYINARDPDGAELSESRVAGNYGSWTNIWGIALSMWMLITKMRPPMPPQQSEEDPISYGSYLLEDPVFDQVDINLRTTIVACMRHNPMDRPVLFDLLGEAERGVKLRYPNESNDMIRTWVSH
ncbi:hypothetical protein F4804DRAFT_44186 [Jackrogersella minutella]|nr:hypothetical protein F4804DRAFT_44186 [Jackrogersella minutella]